LSDGVMTPGALLDWENACEDFFALSKEPIPDDKKVSKVTGGLQNPHISLYVRNNHACLHMLAFTDFMSELRETFLPKDWAKDTLRKILAARMTLDQSFDNFCTEIVASNNLLDGTPLHLSKPRMKEQIYNNITEDLRDKLEDHETELAALNKLTFQKWLNAISEADIKMAKAIRRSMKHVTLELEKEEKKRRNLSGPSRNANTSSTGSTANRRTYTQNNYNKLCNYLPALTEEERALLYENRGCYKCRRLYAEHLGGDCPNDFPDTHVLITSALAATAKAEWEKRRQSKGKPVNRGPAVSSSTPAVAAIVEESSEVSGDENDMEEEENSRVIAMTWLSVVALGDSDSDDSVSPPLTVPNLYWNANTLGCDGFFVPIKAMLDNGAHIVLIRPDAVDMLGLVRKRLRKPQMINVAMNNEKKEKKIEPVLLSEYVSLSLSTLDNSWTSKPVIAVIAPGLCTKVLLGLPFLVHNRIVVDHELPSAIVKDTSVDLLNFVPAPKKILKIQKSPCRKQIEIRLLHRDLLKE